MIELYARDLATLFDYDKTDPIVAAKVMEALSGDKQTADNLLMLLGVIYRKVEVATMRTDDKADNATDDLLMGLDNLLNAVFRWSSAHQEYRDGFIKQLLELPKPRRKQRGGA